MVDTRSYCNGHARLPMGAVRLVNQQGTSNKFWEVIDHPDRSNTAQDPLRTWCYTCHWGRLGTVGQRLTKVYPTRALARRALGVEVARRCRFTSGYRDVTGQIEVTNAYVVIESATPPAAPPPPTPTTPPHAEQLANRRSILRD